MRPIAPPDPRFVRRVRPIFDLLEKYFRYKAIGIGNIPNQRAMVVINHGIIPFHGFLLAKKLFDRGIHPSSLGASFLFKIPGLREFFLKGGAREANPKNARRLLQAGQVVLLAPGGIYEALIARKGLRRIPWERRKGFVRIAVSCGAPIVPTYCQGIHSAYFNSYLLLKPRIKLLEAIRFSFPFFFGIGPLPFPVTLVHHIGKPIPITRRARESRAEQVNRIHHQVIRAMTALAKQKKPGPSKN